MYIVSVSVTFTMKEFWSRV